MTKIKNKQLTSNGKIKAISLFSGIGAYEKAFKNLGIDIDVLNYCEINKFAATAYSAIHNIPEEKNLGDISLVDLKKLPLCDLVTYSFPCFVAGTLILTQNGYKNIEDIQVGDMVLTHKNRFKKVVLPMKKQANKLFRVSSLCSEDLLCTKEHPFYIRRKYDTLITKPSWIKAKYLKKDDYLGIAIDTQEFDTFQDSSFWIAVGQQLGKNISSNNKSEENLLNSITSISKEEVETLINTCFRDNVDCKVFAHNNKKLIYGLAYMIAKIYNIPFCVLKRGDIYHISFSKNKDEKNSAFYEDGYLWYPITNINEEEYDGMVYNMEVEEDNSYTVNNIIVHNCQSISSAGRKEGIIKGKTKSGLVYDALDVIEFSKPKVAIMENVKNLVGKEFINDFHNLLQILDDMGYNNYWKVLNAKNYGIPQNRTRVILVSIRKDIDVGYEFPKEIPLEKTVMDYIDKEDTNVRWVNEIDDPKVYEHLLKKGYEQIEGCAKSPRTREYHGFKQVSDCLLAHDAQTKNIVQFKNKEGKFVIRRMTPVESFKLMGFESKDYYAAKKALEAKYYNGREKSDSQTYRMAGNSVVVDVLQAAIKNIYL